MLGLCVLNRERTSEEEEKSPTRSFLYRNCQAAEHFLMRKSVGLDAGNLVLG
jgi:hypothetical protein